MIPENKLLTKGQYTFGKRCAGVGDAVRIGEGTTAVLRGKQAAYEIAQELGVRFNYNDYLQISKEYIDSQQHPIQVWNGFQKHMRGINRYAKAANSIRLYRKSTFMGHRL